MVGIHRNKNMNLLYLKIMNNQKQLINNQGIDSTTKGLSSGAKEQMSDGERESRLNILRNNLKSFSPSYREAKQVDLYGEPSTSDKETFFAPGYGSANIDKRITNLDEVNNLAASRDTHQTNWEKLGNAGVNLGILTGTTFLQSLGELYGLGKVAVTGKADAIWNNEISNALHNINKWGEENFPIYTNPDDKNKNVFQKMEDFNFWAEQIKNAGFTIGALASGALTGGLLSYIGTGAKLAKGATVLVSSFIQASAEAATEAQGSIDEYSQMVDNNINSNKSKEIEELKSEFSNIIQDFDNKQLEKHKLFNELKDSYDKEKLTIPQLVEENNAQREQRNKELIDKYTKKLKDLQKEIRDSDDYKQNYSAIEDIYKKDLQSIVDKYENIKEISKEEEAKVGNITFAMNQGLLTLTNILPFHRFLSGEMFNKAVATNTGKRLVAKKIAEEAAGKTTLTGKEAIKGWVKGGYKLENAGNFVARTAGKSLLIGADEAVEEGSQYIASTAAQMWGAHNVNELSGIAINPEVRIDMDNYLKAIGQAAEEGFGSSTGQGWTETMAGFIMGLTGVPFVHRNSSGKFRPTVAGGVWEAYQQEKSSRLTKDELESLNNTSQDLKVLTEYLMSNSELQDILDQSVVDKDKNTYDNVLYQSTVRDVQLWRKLGIVDNILNMYKGMEDLSAEEMKTLRESFSEGGNEFTPGVSLIDESITPEKLTARSKELQEEIQSIIKLQNIFENTNRKTGKLSEQDINNLVYYTGAAIKSNNNISESNKKIYDLLIDIVEVLDSVNDSDGTLLQGMKDNLIGLYAVVGNNNKETREIINLLKKGTSLTEVLNKSKELDVSPVPILRELASILNVNTAEINKKVEDTRLFYENSIDKTLKLINSQESKIKRDKKALNNLKKNNKKRKKLLEKHIKDREAQSIQYRKSLNKYKDNLSNLSSSNSFLQILANPEVLGQMIEEAELYRLNRDYFVEQSRLIQENPGVSEEAKTQTIKEAARNLSKKQNENINNNIESSNSIEDIFKKLHYSFKDISDANRKKLDYLGEIKKDSKNPLISKAYDIMDRLVGLRTFTKESDKLGDEYKKTIIKTIDEVLTTGNYTTPLGGLIKVNDIKTINDRISELVLRSPKNGIVYSGSDLLNDYSKFKGDNLQSAPRTIRLATQEEKDKQKDKEEKSNQKHSPMFDDEGNFIDETQGKEVEEEEIKEPEEEKIEGNPINKEENTPNKSVTKEEEDRVLSDNISAARERGVASRIILGLYQENALKDREKVPSPESVVNKYLRDSGAEEFIESNKLLKLLKDNPEGIKVSYVIKKLDDEKVYVFVAIKKEGNINKESSYQILGKFYDSKEVPKGSPLYERIGELMRLKNSFTEKETFRVLDTEDRITDIYAGTYTISELTKDGIETNPESTLTREDLGLIEKQVPLVSIITDFIDEEGKLVQRTVYSEDITDKKDKIYEVDRENETNEQAGNGYMLLEAPDGKYVPINIRTKDINEIKEDSPFFKRLSNKFVELLLAHSEQREKIFSEIISEGLGKKGYLYNVLRDSNQGYVTTFDIINKEDGSYFEIYEEGEGNKTAPLISIKIAKAEDETDNSLINENLIKTADNIVSTIIERSGKSVESEVTSTPFTFKIRFDINEISGNQYIKDLMDSELITTNISKNLKLNNENKYVPVNSSFRVDYNTSNTKEGEVSTGVTLTNTNTEVPTVKEEKVSTVDELNIITAKPGTIKSVRHSQNRENSFNEAQPTQTDKQSLNTEETKKVGDGKISRTQIEGATEEEKEDIKNCNK